MPTEKNTGARQCSVMSSRVGLLRFLIAAAAIWPQPMLADSPPQPYETVRAALIAADYKPLVLKHTTDDYFCVGDGLCQTYPEVLSCVATGRPACRMAFFRPRDRKYRLVITNGDAAPLSVRLTMDASAYDIADIRARQ